MRQKSLRLRLQHRKRRDSGEVRLGGWGSLFQELELFSYWLEKGREK